MDRNVDDDYGIRVLAQDWGGRMLCLLLSLYTCGVFGDVTATIATFL